MSMLLSSRSVSASCNVRAQQRAPVRCSSCARPQQPECTVSSSGSEQLPMQAHHLSKRGFMLALATAAAGLVAQPARADIGEAAIDEYAALESKGKLSSAKDLEAFRNKYKFRRGPDGRVFLKGSKGEYAVRLDMEVSGAMLIRDSQGYVYAIQTESMQQIDLSDDQVVLLMFADGEWEKQMTPIEFVDEAGKVKQLKMEERDFRGVVGVLKVAEAQESK